MSMQGKVTVLLSFLFRSQTVPKNFLTVLSTFRADINSKLINKKFYSITLTLSRVTDRKTRYFEISRSFYDLWLKITKILSFTIYS